MLKWTLVTRKISDLKDHRANPRRLSKQQCKAIEKSMSRFGLVEKPVVTLDGEIISGHQRIAILKRQRAKTVECWQPAENSPSLSQEQIDELAIRLNKNHASWDFDILANEWDVESLLKWGFTKDDFDLDDLSDDDPFAEDQSKKDAEKPATQKCPTCGKAMKKKCA